MVARHANAPGIVQQLVIAGHTFPWQGLSIKELRQFRRLHETPGYAHPRKENLLIAWVLQVVRLHDRVLKGIGRAGMHVAHAFGAMLPDPAGHAGIVIQHADVAFAIARWREHPLEIRSIQAFLRLPEPVHERGTEREDVGPPEHPPCDLSSKPSPSGQLVHGEAVLDLRHHPNRKMVAQVLADAWEFMDGVDIQRLKE